MKPLLLILALAFAVSAQEPEWKLIPEMSGDILAQPGLTVKFFAARIARGDDLVKLSMKAEFPEGAPVDIFRDSAPRGFDISSVVKMEFKGELNCKTLTVKPKGGGEIYQFNGNHIKSKEPPFKITSGHVFAKYFCELGEETPRVKPTLKP